MSKLWANLLPSACKRRVDRATECCDSLLGKNWLQINLPRPASISIADRDHLRSIGCRIIGLAAFLVSTTVGCATWHNDADLTKTVRGLPPPRRHPGDAILEISFVAIRPAKPPAIGLSSQPVFSDAIDDEGSVASDDKVDTGGPESPSDVAVEPNVDIWKLIDESVIVPETRYALRRNGIRIGKAQSVADFTQQLEKIRVLPTESSEVLEVADVQSDLSHSARRITFRVGKRYELPVRQVAQDAQVILVNTGGQTLGQTLSQAQPLFAMRVSSADARTLRLSLRPEIQHGAMRQSWVGNDAALRIENRRDAWVLDELETDVSLEKGNVLVAGCREPAFSLGKHLFTGTTAEGDNDQVLMIVRVVELPDTIIVNAK